MEEIEFILRGIDENLYDLHTLQTYGQLDMDTDTYSEICTALLTCKATLSLAMSKQIQRREQRAKQYEANTRPTISEPLQRDPEQGHLDSE